LLGTNVIRDWTPQVDATIATRILQAGGEIKGKAVCENLSLWASSFSSATGELASADERLMNQVPYPTFGQGTIQLGDRLLDLDTLWLVDRLMVLWVVIRVDRSGW
jgi:hypothetical protein